MGRPRRLAVHRCVRGISLVVVPNLLFGPWLLGFYVLFMLCSPVLRFLPGELSAWAVRLMICYAGHLAGAAMRPSLRAFRLTVGEGRRKREQFLREASLCGPTTVDFKV